MKETYATRQMKIVKRGQKFRISSSDAIRPIQKTAGTLQNRDTPGIARLTASRYPCAGSSPSGPINPGTCRSREKNAEKKISPRARRKIQRAANQCSEC